MSFLDSSGSTTEPSIRRGFSRLHGDRSFVARAFTDPGDTGHIAVHLLERSIALLSGELRGELLDVGCGLQPYRAYFTSATKHMACDFDAERGEVDFACPADKVPLPDGSLDSILCTEVLEHVPEPMAVWKEFHRLLRPGGKVLLTTPMYWPPHELPYDFHRFPEHGLRRLVRESGFELLEILPRGGAWALWGQVTLHALQRFFPFHWQRALWNRMILSIDRQASTPRLTLGWTVLAQKPHLP